mgnify:CR=1 FL=1
MTHLIQSEKNALTFLNLTMQLPFGVWQVIKISDQTHVVRGRAHDTVLNNRADRQAVEIVIPSTNLYFGRLPRLALFCDNFVRPPWIWELLCRTHCKILITKELVNNILEPVVCDNRLFLFPRAAKVEVTYENKILCKPSNFKGSFHLVCSFLSSVEGFEMRSRDNKTSADRLCYQ